MFIQLHPTGCRAEGYQKHMYAKFQFRLRDDIDAPFWLSEPQISDWLGNKKAELKLRKKVAKRQQKLKSKSQP